MGAVIAKDDVACCLMHNKSNTEYNNFLIDMLSETQECVNPMLDKQESKMRKSFSIQGLDLEKRLR